MGDCRELRKDAKMNQGQIRKMTSSIEISFLECWVTHLDLRAPWAPRTPGPWAGRPDLRKVDLSRVNPLGSDIETSDLR